MTTKTLWWIRGFWIAAVLLTLAITGCSVVLYPLARAFGSPSESELAACRRTLTELAGNASTSAWVVVPTYVVATDPAQWDAAVAEPIRTRLASELGAQPTMSSSLPDLSFDPYGGNQLRHAWNRARRYSDWVKRAHLPGDWVIVTEMWTSADRSQLFGSFFFVFANDGRIAYSRFYNRHSFGSATAASIVDVMTGDFLAALKRDAIEHFPKWGVG